MGCVAIDVAFLQKAAVDGDLFKDVLFVFAQDNSWRISFDKAGLAQARYEQVVKGSERLRVWLSILNDHSCYKHIVNIDYSMDNSGIALFLNIANHTSGKKLLVNEKEDCDSMSDFVDKNGIVLYDGYEAKGILTSSNNFFQVTFGNDSPIVNGDNNNL